MYPHYLCNVLIFPRAWSFVWPDLVTLNRVVVTFDVFLFLFLLLLCRGDMHTGERIQVDNAIGFASAPLQNSTSVLHEATIYNKCSNMQIEREMCETIRFDMQPPRQKHTRHHNREYQIIQWALLFGWRSKRIAALLVVCLFFLTVPCLVWQSYVLEVFIRFHLTTFTRTYYALSRHHSRSRAIARRMENLCHARQQELSFFCNQPGGVVCDINNSLVAHFSREKAHKNVAPLKCRYV